MSKSYSKIRHIQEANIALEQRRFSQLLESKMGDVKPLIKEDAAAEAQVKNLEAKVKSGQVKADQGTMDKIIDCIKNNNLSHLMVLTSGAGTYALGLIAVLMGSGVGIPLGLAMSGMIMIILEMYLDEGGTGVEEEVDALVKCMGS
ncbi:MAG: hypothetical protein RLZ10_2868 [Bacteroidota bacterium]|jgi:hypothetical protein